MRILIVDDNEQVLKLLEGYLLRRGDEVTAACSGEEALELVLNVENAFDAVITDYEMAEMNGIELIEKLRDNAFSKPIVLMSGNAALQDEALLNSEVYEFISKPTKLAVVDEVLKRIEQDIANTVTVLCIEDSDMTRKMDITLLLVDDDECSRQEIGHILRAESYNVIDVASAKQALIVYRELPALVVITEIVMPEMDGLELITALKLINAELKCIAIVDNARVELRYMIEAAEVLGAKCVLAKPINESDLLIAVSSVFDSNVAA